MKMLLITQKIHEEDDDLAFVTQWVDELIAQGVDVEVICLELVEFDGRFKVHSLGKESGTGVLLRSWRFVRLITTLRYDSVFVHMNPEYFTLGGWFWWLSKKQSYLWYTHYTDHIHLKIASLVSRKMFAATKQSLPQYEGNPKKVVTGHGVDVGYWGAPNECKDERKMIMVHRLSRSKRVELGIQALCFLPESYTLDIYGRPIDPGYFDELKKIVNEKGLENRVRFYGPVPMAELRSKYPQHRIMINMASETIDKTMLEAMCNGVFPVTTSANMEAIGIETRLGDETPENIAQFISNHSFQKYSPSELKQIVAEGHSLKSLVSKLIAEIQP
jgi:glycosyltransferase involved in cell wall biosynthesis